MTSKLSTFCKQQALFKRLKEEIFDPEIETVLHPSPLRFKVLGLFSFIGQIIFWYLWSVLLPQPYENVCVRLTLAVLGAGLFLGPLKFSKSNSGFYKYSYAVFWLQLPIFFTWMYWMNNCNAVWLGSMAAMVLIYYHFTDWRLATLGLITGASIATAIARWQLNTLPYFSADNAAVLGFCFFAAFALGASNANLRRARLHHSLMVIGIMAHELRTPLATASLIGEAIVSQATNHDETTRVRGLTKLAKRLETLAQTMNHHIDLQMMNARFMQLPPTSQMLSAVALVNKVVTQYPFSSPKEENCFELQVHEDFLFYGSEQQFIQVLNNLLKNALHSLKAAQSRFTLGDLRIELGCRAGTGRIKVFDKGTGISPEHIAHIFEPFFSTNHETGHGLGLAYCKQVVQASGGAISVRAEPATGTTFIIDLPVQSIAAGDNTHHALSSVPPP
jgi:two-component system, CAI-1 autoinducer sensor kinase/phosphatase CqsS